MALFLSATPIDIDGYRINPRQQQAIIAKLRQIFPGTGPSRLSGLTRVVADRSSRHQKTHSSWKPVHISVAEITRGYHCRPPVGLLMTNLHAAYQSGFYRRRLRPRTTNEEVQQAEEGTQRGADHRGAEAAQ